MDKEKVWNSYLMWRGIVLKIQKPVKQFFYVNVPIAILLVVIAKILIGPLTNSEILGWIGCFFVGPFILFAHWLSDFTGWDSSSYEPITWVFIFLYYSFLIHYLFRFFKEKKYKFVVLFITAFVILHGASTYWFYWHLQNLFKR